jgi:hypothetical protein
MNQQQCNQCRYLKEYKISLPKDLSEVILILQQSMHFLEEIDIQTLAPISEKISTLAPKGPWDDSIYHLLKCKGCGAIYELSCNVYHGNGGSFRLATEKALAYSRECQERNLEKKAALIEDSKRAFAESQKWQKLLKKPGVSNDGRS